MVTKSKIFAIWPLPSKVCQIPTSPQVQESHWPKMWAPGLFPSSATSATLLTHHLPCWHISGHFSLPKDLSTKVEGIRHSNLLKGLICTTTCRHSQVCIPKQITSSLWALVSSSVYWTSPPPPWGIVLSLEAGN